MQRKVFLLAMAFVLVCSVQTAQAANTVRGNGNFGLGLGAGTFATGVSMKYFLDSPLSVQGNVGWWRNRYWCGSHHCFDGGGLALSADLLFEQPAFAGNKQVQVAWEIGGGAGMGIDDRGNDFGLGVTFVVGLQLLIDIVPVDVVLEYRPGVYLLPDAFFDFVNFTGHVRYYF
ncbi:MAG: hypothetical protein A2341_14840 [Deltaproteobacteria bacterium RIFOXYB12_FULL_58_9]|nr:MAG: hypothetical protein A2341_14840 [Deltaproteobacteria bacterium RIFOXYB12_FULL_58_9]